MVAPFIWHSVKVFEEGSPISLDTSDGLVEKTSINYYGHVNSRAHYSLNKVLKSQYPANIAEGTSSKRNQSFFLSCGRLDSSISGVCSGGGYLDGGDAGFRTRTVGAAFTTRSEGMVRGRPRRKKSSH